LNFLASALVVTLAVTPSFYYAPLSRRTNLERVPTDLHTKYTYDTLNRITSITSSLPESLGDILYPLYDKLGNRKEENNQLVPDHNFHFTYGYNNRYELTDVSDQLPVVRYQYQYDLTGNRQLATENGVQTAYVPNNLNQYQSVNGQTYTYDPKGNLTNDGTNTYQYDYENRLIKATVIASSSEAIYAYDPLGRRITKEIASTKTLFIHDQDNLLETYNCDQNLQACTLTHSYVYSNRVDESLLLTRYEIPGIGKDYYYHQDALGNVIALTDTQNEVIEYVQYDPYGNPRFFNQNGELIPNSSIGNPKLFTGKTLDPETGLYHFEARTYSPRIGRFLQRDPYTWAPDDPRVLTNSSFRFQKRLIENIGGNLPALQLPYLYTLNNPTNLTDPSGKNVVVNVVVAIGAALLTYKFVSSFKKLYKKASISGENIQGRDRALQCGDIDAAEEYQSKFQQSYTETARATFDFGVSAPGTSLSGPPPTSSIDLLAELVKFIVENIFSNS